MERKRGMVAIMDVYNGDGGRKVKREAKEDLIGSG